MAITSIYYLMFLIVVSILYYTLGHKYRVYFLIVASFVFYYFNQKWYLFFLLSSIAVNYFLCHIWLKYRLRVAIYSAVIYNILLLAFFKYVPVILFGYQVPENSIWSRLILPVRISFFSFQAIGYVLDLYWSGGKKQSSVQQFALYMSFFPQLLSGPIARAKGFIPQVDKKKSFDYNTYVTGGRLILWGLFKKLVVANNLSSFTDAIFNNHTMHNGSTMFIGTIAYTIQVYMDFSGYSDIAIGSAKLLGFSLMENFRSPFFAKSVSDFWRRWHISLSSWVRDYVNTPLQYALRSWGKIGILIAAFITFFIIGIWHGASLNYVVFGLLQGLAISYEFFTQDFRRRMWSYVPERFANIISNIIVFSFFSFSTILFRVSLPEALLVMSKLSIGFRGIFWGSKQVIIYSVIGIFIVWFVEFIKKDRLFQDYIAEWKLLWRWSFYLTGTVLIILIGALSNESFIYFQF